MIHSAEKFRLVFLCEALTLFYAYFNGYFKKKKDIRTMMR